MKIKHCIYVAGFLVGMIAAVCFFTAKLPDGKLHMYVLDVGQGDAILMILPDGNKVLIDGGPDDKVMSRLAEVLPFYDRTIDLVILTHPHPDHIIGLIDVIKRYDVNRLALTGIKYDYPGYDTFLEEVAQKRIPVFFTNGKEDLKFGEVILDLMFPLAPIQGQYFGNVNNSSIVFRILYGRNKFLLQGDLEVEGEMQMVESGLDLRASVIKVGHHGSRTASSDDYLAKVLAEFAVISCGAGNRYNHPHIETMRALKKYLVEVWRTDLEGTVEVASDGNVIEIRPSRV